MSRGAGGHTPAVGLPGRWLLVGTLTVVPPALFVWGTLLAGTLSPMAGVSLLPVVVPAAFVGALLVLRFPRNPIGWVLYAQALGIGFEETALGWSAADLPGAVGAAWVASWAWVIGLVGLLVVVPLTFPDGRLLSRRWRPVLWLAAGGVTGFVVGNAFHPGTLLTGEENPLASTALAGALGVLRTAGAVAIAGSTGLAVASAVRRFRVARSAERAQLKWLVAGAVLGVGGLVAMGVLYETGRPDVAKVVMGVAATGLPVAIAVAILRYRLYDIDLVINRTLVYTTLSALLAVVYAGGVVVLGRLLQPLTGTNEIAVAASTLGVAALFSPARRGIQKLVDRRFYRSRYDAQRTVAEFAVRLRDEVDLEMLLVELQGVARRTLTPTSVAVWVRPDGESVTRS